MYFKNRVEAGRALASKIRMSNSDKYAVIALNNGGVLVGAQIAMKLHASLMLLLNDKIVLPGETDPLATMTSSTFTYNKSYSEAERDEMVGEYHGFIDAQRIESFHKLNALLTDGGDIDLKDLRHNIVVLVVDALPSGALLDVAADFLKTIKIKKLVIATPLASVDAIDRMHLVGDEIYCLSVAENLMEADHYYDDNFIPDRPGILKILRDISMNWEFTPSPP